MAFSPHNKSNFFLIILVIVKQYCFSSTLFHSKKSMASLPKLFHKPLLISVVVNQAQNLTLQFTRPYPTFSACPGLKNSFWDTGISELKPKNSGDKLEFSDFLDLIPKSPALKVWRDSLEDLVRV